MSLCRLISNQTIVIMVIEVEEVVVFLGEILLLVMAFQAEDLIVEEDLTLLKEDSTIQDLQVKMVGKEDLQAEEADMVQAVGEVEVAEEVAMVLAVVEVLVEADSEVVEIEGTVEVAEEVEDPLVEDRVLDLEEGNYRIQILRN